MVLSREKLRLCFTGKRAGLPLDLGRWPASYDVEHNHDQCDKKQQVYQHASETCYEAEQP